MSLKTGFVIGRQESWSDTPTGRSDREHSRVLCLTAGKLLILLLEIDLLLFSLKAK